MDQHKVTELAQAFSQSCQQVVKDKPWVQKLSSPTIMLIALTVINVMGPGHGDSKGSWAG